MSRSAIVGKCKGIAAYVVLQFSVLRFSINLEIR
jgi:hypothetical protein